MATIAAPSSRTRHKVVCPHDCPDTCVMTVEVENGRAVGLGGDASHRFTQGFLCAKVNRYLERVSWDEALDMIANRFRATIAEHGPQSILPYSYAGNMGLLSYASMDRRF